MSFNQHQKLYLNGPKSADASNFKDEANYVDIHGRDIRVVSDKTGEVFVPLDELRNHGFTIFRKSQYSKLIVDDADINQHFESHLLQAAKNYMLTNKMLFNEQQILETINNCEKAIRNKSTAPTNSTPPASKFMQSRSVAEGPDSDLQIKVSTTTPSPATPNASKPPTSSSNPKFGRSGPTYQQSPDEQPRRQNGFNPQHNRNRNANNQDFSGNGYEQRNGTNYSNNNNNNNRGLGDRKSVGESSTEFLNSITFTVKPLHPPAVDWVIESEYEVTVSAKGTKPMTAYVQDQSKVAELLEIVELCQEEARVMPTVQRMEGRNVYMAELRGKWFRCQSVRFKPLIVFFIDHGVFEEVAHIKELSPELARRPAMAIRVKLSNRHGDFDPQLNEVVKIKPLKQYEDGTYLITSAEDDSASSVHSFTTKAPEPAARPEPPPAMALDRPRTLCALRDNLRVICIDHDKAQLVVRSQECNKKKLQIGQQIAELAPQPVGHRVMVDQMVLVQSTFDGWVRARVLMVNGSTCQVEYLDFYGKGDYDARAMRLMPNDLAFEPVTYMLTPSLNGFGGKGFSNKMEEEFQRLVNVHTKFTVCLDSGSFDLAMKEGDNTVMLSEHLLSLEQPPKPIIKPVVPSPPVQQSPTSAGRVFLKNLKPAKVTLGVKDYCPQTFTSKNDITLMDQNDSDMADYLGQVIIMEEELEDPEPYQPANSEVCLGLHNSEWYRCVALTKKGDLYQVRFIDFGNVEILNSEQLRKLKSELKDVPILGIHCRFAEPCDADMEAALKETLELGDKTYKFLVKGQKDGKYEIDLAD